MIEATPTKCPKCGGDMWLFKTGSLPGDKAACKVCYKLWDDEYWLKPVDIWKEQ